MKLMTKKVMAVVLTLAMTIGMAMSAMALSGVSDSLLESVGIDPDKAVWITDWVEVEEGDAGAAASDEADVVLVTANEDGSFTVDLSSFADLSGYTKISMVHRKQGDNQEIKSAPNGSATWDSLSPFRLVGEKKSSSSSSSSSSKKSSSSSSSSSSKSPKTGMDNSWMLWLLAAGVFAGSSVIAYNRKRG